MARLCEAIGLNEVKNVRLNKVVRGASKAERVAGGERLRERKCVSGENLREREREREGGRDLESLRKRERRRLRALENEV